MPTILRKAGFRFFFFSNDGNEPPHKHVEKGDGAAKYWLTPVKKAYIDNLTSSEIKRMERIINNNQEFFKNKWYEYFGY